MVAVGDHIRVTARQSIVNVEAELLNVYYYRVTGVTGSPIINDSGVGLETWYTEEVGGVIAQVQVTTLVHQSILVESMENWATEFLDLPINPVLAGTAPGDAAPSSIAWSFTYGRVLRTTRNGRKSIPGVPEGFTVGNEPTPSAMPLLINVAVALGSGWTIDNGDGSGWSMSPVIAKTPVPPATRPTVYNNVSAVSFRGIGTMNTRKRL